MPDNKKLIVQGNRYGNPREYARRVEAFYEKADGLRPEIVSQRMMRAKSGRLVPRVVQGADTITSSPMFYDPRWSSPDKFYYPKDEKQANNIWRHFYNRDPITAVGTDLFSDLPWSEYDILGLEDDSVQQLYLAAMDSCKILKWLPLITHEFLKLGKAIPHLIWDNDKGYWSKLFLHDPDYIQVFPVPFLDEEPLLNLVPTPELRQMIVMAQQDPRMRHILRKLPNRLFTLLIGGLPVPLDNMNVTYLARKSSPYEILGTSLYSRIFRVGMLEDVLTSATISVAQRNAAPLRIFKLGDREHEWLPNEEDEAKLAELLTVSETDPFAALIFHYGLETETVGVADRLFSVTREFDFIERVKLLAMGVAKSFLIGETSYAAATAGLQTMTQRLYSLRQRIEEGWLYPKFLYWIAKLNKLYKRSDAELSHRIRIKRDDDSYLMIPKIKWHKSLEPTRDSDLLRLWKELMDVGIVSKRTLSTGAGLDLDTERQNIESEQTYEKDHVPPAMEKASKSGKREGALAPVEEMPLKAIPPFLSVPLWDSNDTYFGIITAADVEPLVEMLKTEQSSDPDWEDILVEYDKEGNKKAGQHGPNFDSIDAELVRRGYTDVQIKAVFNILAHEGFDFGVLENKPKGRNGKGNPYDLALPSRDLVEYDRALGLTSGSVVSGH